MRVKSGLAEMLKGGVIMDVTSAEQARSRAAGLYVIPPFKEPTAALDLLGG